MPQPQIPEAFLPSPVLPPVALRIMSTVKIFKQALQDWIARFLSPVILPQFGEGEKPEESATAAVNQPMQHVAHEAGLAIADL